MFESQTTPDPRAADTPSSSAILDLLATSGRFLKQRERDFLISIASQLTQRSHLSYSQERWLREIQHLYTGPGLERILEWESAWGAPQRHTALRIAHYYESNPPYFSDYVNKILSNPEGFILSLGEWEKFTQNKYAQKILLEYKKDPKFKKKDCVQLRSSNRIDLANHVPSVWALPNRRANRLCANKTGFVLEVDSKPITRAAKGSRIYKILLIGEASPIYAHESDLKKKRGSKR